MTVCESRTIVGKNQMMKRPHFTMLSGLSLVLAIIVAALWVRSYPLEERIWVFFGNNQLRLGTTEGLAFASLDVTYGGLVWDWSVEWESIPHPDLAPVLVDELHYPRLLGFGAMYWSDPGGKHWQTSATCGLWFLLLCFLLAPARWVYCYWKSRRQSVSVLMCAACGYDLCASTDTCPECGAAIDKPVV